MGKSFAPGQPRSGPSGIREGGARASQRLLTQHAGHAPELVPVRVRGSDSLDELRFEGVLSQS
eukprot:1288214-Alexandrium_andersonii.AAC.1